MIHDVNPNKSEAFIVAKSEVLPEILQLPSQARDSLHQLTLALADVVNPEVLSIHVDLDSMSEATSTINEIDALSSTRCLYYFESCDPVDNMAMRERFERFRTAEERYFKCSRINNPDSNYLYVGSSRNIKLRLRQHLGYGAEQTYSMHLIHWAVGMQLKLRIVCAIYPDDTHPDVLQLLEDTLWDSLQPMFGKKGTN